MDINKVMEKIEGHKERSKEFDYIFDFAKWAQGELVKLNYRITEMTKIHDDLLEENTRLNKLLKEELENTYNLGRDIEALEDIGMNYSLQLKPFQNPKNWTVHIIQGKKVYGFNKPELIKC